MTKMAGIQSGREDGEQEASGKMIQRRRRTKAGEQDRRTGEQDGAWEVRCKEIRGKGRDTKETGGRPKGKAVGVRQEEIVSEVGQTRD